MSALREAAQQALEALEEYQSKGAPFLACDGAVDALRAALAQQAEPVSADPHTTTLRNLLECCLSWEPDVCVLGNVTARQAITALRAALAQQAEPLNLADPAVQKRLATQWGYVPAAQAEPDLSRCPRCNGPADNGFDRSIPPSPYLCTKCMAEPVEPVAWLQPKTVDAHTRPDLGYETCSKADYGAFPVCHAPPRRTMVPLTEEEIKTAFHAARNAKLGASQDNSRHRLSVIEIARAVERAVWEKNHGQA